MQQSATESPTKIKTRQPAKTNIMMRAHKGALGKIK